MNERTLFTKIKSDRNRTFNSTVQITESDKKVKKMVVVKVLKGDTLITDIRIGIRGPLPMVTKIKRRA